MVKLRKGSHGVETMTHGSLLRVNTPLTKAGLSQVCRDLATFAGPGNRFLPGRRCIRWVTWSYRRWSGGVKERLLRGGSLQCKEFRFSCLRRENNKVIDWPEYMPCDEDILEAWGRETTDVLLPVGVYETQLVALDHAPRWTNPECQMLRDALFEQDCHTAQVRHSHKFYYYPPPELEAAGLE